MTSDVNIIDVNTGRAMTILLVVYSDDNIIGGLILA